MSWKSRWRFPHLRLREWHVGSVRSLSLSVIAQVVVESPYITSTGRSDYGRMRLARIRTRVSGYSAMLVHSDATNRHASRDLGHGRPGSCSSPPSQSCGNEQRPSLLIAWCCCWAAFWLIIGFFTFGLGWIGVPFSLPAILIPIGAHAQPMPPLPYYPPAPRCTSNSDRRAIRSRRPRAMHGGRLPLPAASARWVEPARLKAKRQRPWLVGATTPGPA